LQESNTRLKDIQNEIIISFADMVESRDNCTGEHIKRTGEYLNVLVRKMSEVPEYKDQLTDDIIELMCKAAPLHDIGKIKISDNILNKPAGLTPDEFDIIKTHTNSGSEIILRSLINIEDADYLDIAVKMALYHHEKWDGSGYPCQLAGKNIPLCARVMAVVDVFDALTSKRVYKEAYTIDKALEIMLESKGTHFDPDIIDIFISIRSDIEKIYNNIRY
ncbi:MAG: HD domain-containing protein, partial [Oscillospiraceae bacterium]|nr:HD domain-containing protein [Oscillospiraceae bacterium]